MIDNNNRPKIINYQPPYPCHEREYQPPIQNNQNQLNCHEAAFQFQSKPNHSPNNVNDVINVDSIATVGSPGKHTHTNPKLRFQDVQDRSSTGTPDNIPITPETPPFRMVFLQDGLEVTTIKLQKITILNLFYKRIMNNLKLTTPCFIN